MTLASLTCVACKLLEHIVFSNIMAHLDARQNICIQEVAIDTLILDFEKAFDTPPHELLKSKL